MESTPLERKEGEKGALVTWQVVAMQHTVKGLLIMLTDGPADSQEEATLN